MPRTMIDAQNEIRDLAAQIRMTAQQLSAAAANPETEMATVTNLQNSLRDMNARMEAMQAAYDAQFTGAQERAAAQQPQSNPAEERALRDIIGSREYARAFAYAIRNGIRPSRGRENEQLRPLYDAMTIGGGDPAGEDGGFLIPIDIDNRIFEIRRTLNPLANIFNSEEVLSNSGWRPMDNAPTEGMAPVDEMAAIQAGEQPTFTKVTYTLTKYGLFIPVSGELASDEVANLFNYLARWIAKKSVITENNLLIAAIDDLVATDIAEGSELSGIKSALNKGLDPAIAANATILTNQSGFDILDNLVDGTGRPLLSQDPATGMPMLLKTRPIVVASDAALPNESTNTKAPVYIGDFTQYATLFARNPLEVLSTDIGGDAWRKDSIEVRGVKRMAVAKFDTAAAVHRTLAL